MGHCETPRIYVACLAAYNNGKLHGVWIDADQDEDTIAEAIQAMLAKSPEPGAEEWAIHDQEGFHSIELGENPRVADIAAIGEFISDNDDNMELIIEVANNFHHKLDADGLEKAKEYLTDNYRGVYDKLEDWAYEFAKDTGAELGAYANYIDWERVAEDAETNGEIFSIELNGKVHVFTNT